MHTAHESPEHTKLRSTVRDFAQAEIAPHLQQWDRDRHFPVDVVRKMGDLGLFGLTAPRELGGSGGGLTELCLAVEELGRVDQSLGITLGAAVGLGINPLLANGTPEQQARWLPDLVAGRSLGAFGLTEPGAGSDANAMATTAQLRDGEWVIDGAKQFITNSGTPITSVCTVAARTGTNPDGSPELSAIVVPADSPGYIVEPPHDKMSWRISDTHPIILRDVHVPEGNLLGERGNGFKLLVSSLNSGRVAVAALAVGCLQTMLDLAVEHAGVRPTFGGPIGRKQGVAFQIADLAVMLDAARLLTYRAAALKDTGAPVVEFRQAASIAKLYATESAVTATRIAAQVFGGYGVMEDGPVARFYRDAKVLEIGEGTSELQRMLIARGLGLPVE
ncbi:acyl-CoA dehydrogenase family protein [Antribacter sp. KLBMP9083]|uniref:Acyl-CoA dehydrogenase family protein n=1 Tax=Antribacter soli TaxID=2910976 RepID=A0AA41QH48_9MICO|nr:acyl-CoA dehydrogenase family protein [Antribacter soli]MCF4121989.1 acyl-CoA dehydrogenase family protein [Antribacter soli]